MEEAAAQLPLAAVPRLQVTLEGSGPEGAGKLVVLLCKREEQRNIEDRCQAKNKHKIAPVLYAARALRPILTTLVSQKYNPVTLHPDISVVVSVSSNYVVEALSAGQSPLIANS